MNMKKSIAGVMAGAMAISAMATVASADQEQIVLSYDLKEYVPTTATTTVKITASYDQTTTSAYKINNYNDVNGGYVTLGLNLKNADQGYTLLSASISGKQVAKKDATGNYVIGVDAPSKTYYSADKLGMLEDTDRTVAIEYADGASYTDDNNHAFKIQFATSDYTLADGLTGVKSGAYIIDTLKVGGTTTVSEAVLPEYVVTATTKATDAVTAKTYLAAKDATTGSVDAADLATDGYDFGSLSEAQLVAEKVGGKVDSTTTSGSYYVYTETETTAATAAKTVYFNANGNQVSTPVVFTSESEAVDALAAVTGKTGYNVADYSVAPATKVTNEDDVKDAVEETTPEYYAFGAYSITYTYEVYKRVDDSAANYANTQVSVLSSGIDGVTSASNLAPSGGTFAGSATWVGLLPTSDLTAPLNVVNELTTRKADGLYYTNPVAVINDVIANNEEVAFTFNSYVGAYHTPWDASWEYYDRMQADSWGYTQGLFGQHLYATTNAGDSKFDGTTYGSYSSAWGTNLFNAGITVNSAYTMQLSDTTAFTWGDSSITFLWSSITDGKVTNATTLLSSMLLYTPTTWYWDSLDISVGSAISEDIVPGAGIEDDGDVVVDEDTDEAEAEVDADDDLDVDFTDDDDFADDDFSDDDYADDDFGDDDFSDDDFSDDDFDDNFDADDDVDADADTTTDVDVAPAEVASPQTGNAPIALAVIPVALAAAAVVAKKKN
jgi:hypothetical protein